MELNFLCWLSVRSPIRLFCSHIQISQDGLEQLGAVGPGDHKALVTRVFWRCGNRPPTRNPHPLSVPKVLECYAGPSKNVLAGTRRVTKYGVLTIIISCHSYMHGVQFAVSSTIATYPRDRTHIKIQLLKRQVFGVGPGPN